LPRLVMNYMQHEIQSPENIAWEKRTRKHWVESNFASIRAELKDTKERDWATAFDHLETIKPTLCGKNGVFEWCFDHLDDYYPAVAALWLDEGYGRYAMYYGHWPELLHYLDLLIKEANQRKDRLHEFKALIIHTHLSTLMYHHPKALESKMQRAEYLSATYPAEIPTYWRHRAVITRAFLYSREKKYAEAIAVLRDLEPQFQAIRDTLDHPHSAEDGLDVERDMLRCAGELWYRCGMTYYYAALAQHDDDALEQAAHYFELAWAICEQQHFQHTMFMTINYLIHVELEMGHLDRAQWLFDTYWESVQQAKEERRIAGFRFVHARLIWETCQITGIATPSTRIALEVSQEVERALTTYEHLHMFYEQRRIRIFARQVLEDIASLLPANALADPLDSQQIHPTLQQATVILHEMVEAA
jgi:tetratricopeptide (TPR) repeat protein